MTWWTTTQPRYRLQADPVDFGIDDPIVPVELWSRTSTNHYEVTGTLTVNGSPVVGAVLKANDYTLPAPTDESGAFTVKGDKTVLDRAIITVKDLANASVDGQPLSGPDADALLAAQATVESAFLMTLDDTPALTVGASDQVISGTLLFADGETPVPALKLWGYELSGTVLDTAGQPLEGVYVSIRDDEGETWSLSDVTGPDGMYALRFYPLGGSTFTIRVAQGNDSFQSDHDLAFDDETSAKVDLVLDTGMAMLTGTGPDGEFEITDVPGAEYVGYMAGLAAGDTPIDAAITWPDETGRFTITIPQLETDAPLSFYQARLRFFSTMAMEPGSDIEPDIIPATLDPRIPSGLPPVITPTS